MTSAHDIVPDSSAAPIAVLAPIDAAGDPDRWPLRLRLTPRLAVEIDLLAGDEPDGLMIHGDAAQADPLRAAVAADPTLAPQLRVLVLAERRLAVQPAGLWRLDSAVAGSAVVVALRRCGEEVAGLAETVRVRAEGAAAQLQQLTHPLETGRPQWMLAATRLLDAAVGGLAAPDEVAAQPPPIAGTFWAKLIPRRHSTAQTPLAHEMGDDREHDARITLRAHITAIIDREVAVDATIRIARLLETDTTPRVRDAAGDDPSVLIARFKLRYEVAEVWGDGSAEGRLRLECLTRTGLGEAALQLVLVDADICEPLRLADLTFDRVSGTLGSTVQAPTGKHWAATLAHDLAPGRDIWSDLLVCPESFLDEAAAGVSVLASGLARGPRRRALLQVVAAAAPGANSPVGNDARAQLGRGRQGLFPTAVRRSPASISIAACRDARASLADAILTYLDAGHDASELASLRSGLALFDRLLA